MSHMHVLVSGLCSPLKILACCMKCKHVNAAKGTLKMQGRGAAQASCASEQACDAFLHSEHYVAPYVPKTAGWMRKGTTLSTGDSLRIRRTATFGMCNAMAYSRTELI